MTRSFLFTQDFFAEFGQRVDVLAFSNRRLGSPAHTRTDRLVLDRLFHVFFFAGPLSGLVHPLFLVHSIQSADTRHKHFQPPRKKMPKPGDRKVPGVKRTPGGTVAARSDASAKKGIFVSAEEFQQLKEIVGSPKQKARSAEERQRVAQALKAVKAEIAMAREEFRQARTEGEPPDSPGDILDLATDAVLRRASEESPEQGSVLLATMSNQIDTIEPQTQEQQAQKDRLERQVSTSQSEIMGRLKAREEDLKRRPEVVSRKLAFGNNPEIATAAPLLQNSDEEEQESDSDEEEQEQSTEGFLDSDDSDEEEQGSDEEEQESDSDEEEQGSDEEERESSVYDSPLAQVGVVQTGRNFLAWATGQTNAPEDFADDVEQAQSETDDLVDGYLEELEGPLGQDAEEDEAVLEDIGDGLLAKAREHQRVDEPELAAATLVAGKEFFDTAAGQTQVEEVVRTQSGRMLDALEAQPPSTVKQGFIAGFRTQSEATPRPGASARAVDGASNPQVATAAAQHAAAVAPPAPAAVGVAGVAQNAVQQQMAQQPAPPKRRTGSLFTGPPPVARAENVAVLTQNLEDAPLVAGLVQRGLLKTEDVMTKPYVEAMEKSLRKQKVTQEVAGRDVRYRSARAAYRPPVNVTTTGTPGVYRYQRPRFARPTFG
jgi:hypothetical protein